jgi:hypothetical protein
LATVTELVIDLKVLAGTSDGALGVRLADASRMPPVLSETTLRVARSGFQGKP